MPSTRPSDTFRPRGRLPLDPFASPATTAAGPSSSSKPSSSYSYSSASASAQRTSVYSSSGGPIRRDSDSSAGTSGSAEQEAATGYSAAPMWRVPRGVVFGPGYGYGYGSGSGPGYGYGGETDSGMQVRTDNLKEGQVVLVLGEPLAADLLPLLSSPYLADPTKSIVLIATHNPPGYVHRKAAAPAPAPNSNANTNTNTNANTNANSNTNTDANPMLSPGPGPGPAIRILRLQEPLDAHHGGALRLVSLFERAGRVVDRWRESVGAGAGAKGKGSKVKGKNASAPWTGDRIIQLAEDAQGEFVCVEPYRPTPKPGAASATAVASSMMGPSVSSSSYTSASAEHASSTQTQARPRYPSPPPSEAHSTTTTTTASADHEKKRKFRFSMMSFGASASSTNVAAGSDSPRPLMESRMPSSPPSSPPQPPPPAPTASVSSRPSTATAASSPYAQPKPRSQSRSSTASLPFAAFSTSPPRKGMSGLGVDGRTFDAIINFLPASAPDKALLKHAILVSTLGAQYLGVGDETAKGGAVNLNAPVEETAANADGGRLSRRSSSTATRRMSMTQRLSGFFGMGGGGSVVEEYERAEREREAKEKQREKERLDSTLNGTALHAHVVHILPPNMGSAHERPHGQKLVQSIEQFLLAFAYPLGSMLGGSGGGRGSSFGYGYKYSGSSGSLSSLHSLGMSGMGPPNMNMNMSGLSAFSSAASSRSSSSSSLSAMAVPSTAHVAPSSTTSSAQGVPHSQSVGSSAPRPRSVFSTGSPSGSRPASYIDGPNFNANPNANTVSGSSSLPPKVRKPTTPPSAYSARQRVRSGAASPHRPSSVYSNPAVANPASTGVLSGSGSLAQLAAQMAGRPVPYLVAPGVFGAKIGAAGVGMQGQGPGAGGRRRMTYGEAVLLGLLDWDSGVDGVGAGRAYIAWGDVVCDGEEGAEDEGGSATVPFLKHSAVEATPRPGPTTTQLPTPPESSVGSAGSSVEGGDLESEGAEDRRDADQTPRFSEMPRFTRTPSSSAHSSGSSVESAPATEAASLTSLPTDPSRAAEPAAGEANGEPTASSSTTTSIPSEALPAFPSTSSPLTSFSMVSEPEATTEKADAPAPPEMIRDDPLRMSVCDAPNLDAMFDAFGGVEMNKSKDNSGSQDGSATGSAPAAEPPMMITLTSATVASVEPAATQVEAVPPPVVTGGSDSGYGSTESAGSSEVPAAPLSHKAARPLHVSSTANPDLPEETQKAMQEAVAKLVGQTEAAPAEEDGKLSRSRSSTKKKGSKRSKSPSAAKSTSPTLSQGKQSSPTGAKAGAKESNTEAVKNGKFQGAWRKFGSWRRNGTSMPAATAGATKTP